VGSTRVRAARLRDFGLLGTARAFKSDSITQGQKAQMCVGVQSLRKSQSTRAKQRKGKIYEKTSLHCIGGNGITSGARPAFRRSGYGWRGRSRNRIWLSRLPIRLLRLRLLSIWLLPTVSVLQLLFWAVILLVQRTPLIPTPPARSLLPILSRRRV
jgi:hypothetical protein